jgi:AcrR family transcriptional regulator
MPTSGDRVRVADRLAYGRIPDALARRRRPAMTPHPAQTPLESPELGEPHDSAPRTLRADARRNRQAVIAAARELFGDQGLEAQMPDVAKAANVGVGTVYRHFPTKDHLIAALVADRFERLGAKAREALEMPDAWEGIAEFVRFAARLQAEDRGLCEVMGSRPDLSDTAASHAELPELCDQLVRRAQESGQLRPEIEWQDIPMIACGLGSVTHAPPPPSIGRWPRLVEIILDGLRAPGSGDLPEPLRP